MRDSWLGSTRAWRRAPAPAGHSMNSPPRRTEGMTVDKIFLTALSTEAVIGIFDWEREIRQRIEIDLEMSVDLAAATKRDSIEDTLNYKSVAKQVLALVEASRFRLVETLAE